MTASRIQLTISVLCWLGVRSFRHFSLTHSVEAFLRRRFQLGEGRVERPAALRHRERINSNRLFEQRDQRGFVGIVEFENGRHGVIMRGYWAVIYGNGRRTSNNLKLPVLLGQSALARVRLSRQWRRGRLVFWCGVPWSSRTRPSRHRAITQDVMTPRGHNLRVPERERVVLLFDDRVEHVISFAVEDNGRLGVWFDVHFIEFHLAVADERRQLVSW
jgi:hypothetical protein